MLYESQLFGWWLKGDLHFLLTFVLKLSVGRNWKQPPRENYRIRLKAYSNFDISRVLRIRNTFIRLVKHYCPLIDILKLQARGKPSTWWPRGKLVEHYGFWKQEVPSNVAAHLREHFASFLDDRPFLNAISRAGLGVDWYTNSWHTITYTGIPYDNS